jgi:hypothetical protein
LHQTYFIGINQMTEQLPEWRNPPLVTASSHEDKIKKVQYSISADLTGTKRLNWKRTPLYWVWVHLLGKLPPFTNAGIIQRDGVSPTFSTLLDATACFQGVERPHNTEDNGNSVLVYVLKPSATVEYAVRMGAPIRAIELPTTHVLTVQVCLTTSLHTDGSAISGIVTRFEPVVADTDLPMLPEQHKERYRIRHW